MTNFTRAIGFLMGVGMLSGLQAAPIVQTISKPGSGFQLTQWSATYTFNTFDTTLGTLNSVTIGIVDHLTGTVTVTNNSGAPGSYTGQLETTALFSLNSSPTSGNAFYSDTILKGGSVGTLANGTSGQTTLNGTGGTLIDTGNAAVDPSVYGLSLSLFTSVGTSTFDIYELVTGRTGFLGPAPASAEGIPSANSAITITYNYTAAPPGGEAPEPATFALLGGSLLGLGFLRKRVTAK